VRWICDHRSLLTSAVSATFVMASHLLLAQLSGATTPTTSESHQVVSESGAHSASSQSEPKPQQQTPEQIGDALFSQKHYQAAIEAFNKAPRDSAEVWNKMGISYQLMLDTEDALRCYLESLKLDPRNAVVLNNLGTIYASLKDYRTAEHYYRKALQLDPNSAVFFKNLGTDLLMRGKYKQGGKLYAAAIAIDPHAFDRSTSLQITDSTSTANRGAMNYYLARTCAHAGLNDRAIEYLRMAVNEGFVTPKKVMEDSEFTSLRGIPAFEQILAPQGTP
jgi:tetratricopeptide (TPR) repeat protein